MALKQEMELGLELFGLHHCPRTRYSRALAIPVCTWELQTLLRRNALQMGNRSNQMGQIKSLATLVGMQDLVLYNHTLAIHPGTLFLHYKQALPTPIRRLELAKPIRCNFPQIDTRRNKNHPIGAHSTLADSLDLAACNQALASLLRISEIVLCNQALPTPVGTQCTSEGAEEVLATLVRTVASFPCNQAINSLVGKKQVLCNQALSIPVRTHHRNQVAEWVLAIQVGTLELALYNQGALASPRGTRRNNQGMQVALPSQIGTMGLVLCNQARGILLSKATLQLRYVQMPWRPPC